MNDWLSGVLVEEDLGAVVFAMDYLQLAFSHAASIAYVWPTVTSAGSQPFW